LFVAKLQDEERYRVPSVASTYLRRPYAVRYEVAASAATGSLNVNERNTMSDI